MKARCRVCSRLLTSEKSVAAGVGPECAKRTASQASLFDLEPEQFLPRSTSLTSGPIGEQIAELVALVRLAYRLTDDPIYRRRASRVLQMEE